MEYVGAYLIRGGVEVLDALLVRLNKEKVVAPGSPDLFARKYRSFGVDDAAEIRGRVRTKPVVGEQRIFAIHFPAMTTEAQNALLKTLEEPAANAAIFLVTPAPETMLPTIRSRSLSLAVDAKVTDGIVDAEDFLAAPAAKRLEMLKPLYEHEEEGRDIGAVISFLQSLERTFAKSKNTREREEGIRTIYRARKYATDRGSLLKALLEQVALLAPKL